MTKDQEQIEKIAKEVRDGWLSTWNGDGRGEDMDKYFAAWYLAKIQPFVELLRLAKCPECDGSGGIQVSAEDVQQCRWCYEKNETLKGLEE